MNHRKCSIIIRCYNEEEHIGRLLEGIRQQTQDAEIIIVDSGSTDATVAIASRYSVKIVTIEKEDFSFGYSLNVGCQEAAGEVLVFASAHVYPVHKDWLECLLAPFGDEKTALVYGKQRGNENTTFSEHQVFAKWFPDHPNPNQDHPFCNNANAAVRRSLWEHYPYDETLTGLEDLAWAKTVTSAGYKIIYEPKAEIIHVHDEDARALFNRYRREAIALKAIYPQERFGLADFSRMSFQNIFSDSFHALQRGIFWKSIGSVVTFRLMQFGGTYRGFSQRGQIPRQLRQKFYYPNELNFQPGTYDRPHNERPQIDYSQTRQGGN